MNEVTLDPRQAPAPAELLLGADLGREAQGRPIRGRLESEDGGAREPGPWLKLGAVQTRRLAVSEGTYRPSGSVYGNPLGGTRDNAPDNAPVVPIDAPVVGRTDVPDRTGPSSATSGSSTTRPTRRWPSPSCGRPPRRVPRRHCAAPSRDGPATRARKRPRGGSPAGRPSAAAPRRSPGHSPSCRPC